jgi:hypothetical protein
MSWKLLQGLFYLGQNIFVLGAARNQFDLNINPQCWEDLNTCDAEENKTRFFHVRLGPMDESAIGKLVRKRLPDNYQISELNTSVARTVFLESGGSPLIACELLDVLYPVACANGGPWMMEANAKNVEELVLNRLDSLAPGVRSYLNLGAILGSPFYLDDVIAVLERYNNVSAEEKTNVAESARDSLQEAVNHGLLNVVSNQLMQGYLQDSMAYTFSHSMWQETLANQILDEWKDEMRQLVSDVVLTNEKRRNALAFGHGSKSSKNKKPKSSKENKSSSRKEKKKKSKDASTDSECASAKRTHSRLKAMTELFRRSYKSKGRKGAFQSIQKLKHMFSEKE